MVYEVFGFAIVFAVAFMFLLLTILTKSKFSVMYAVFSFVLWLTLAGVNLVVFAETPSLMILSYVWFAVGVFSLLIGLVISILCLKADNEKKEMQID